jgi:hypothetical protein
MGGLIARYFLEVLGGRELTSKLVTIGTPYRGSINALDTLVNGVFLGLGPIGFSVDKLVRSFPSVHQLLPTYECLDVGNGELCNLAGSDLPNISKNDVTEALAFHSRIADAVEKNPKYETFSIKGVDQPTSQSALLRNGKIQPTRSYKGADKSGDGTVLRPSSHPPEWPNEGSSVFVSQSHAVLQSTDSILTQIFGMLTGNLGKFMGGTGIGLDIPAVVEAGNTVPVDVVSQDGNPTLALQAVCHGEDGQPRGNPKLMSALGDGRYHTKLADLPEGAFKITVQSATAAKPIDPVSDWSNYAQRMCFSNVTDPDLTPAAAGAMGSRLATTSVMTGCAQSVADSNDSYTPLRTKKKRTSGLEQNKYNLPHSARFASERKIAMPRAKHHSWKKRSLTTRMRSTPLYRRLNGSSGNARSYGAGKVRAPGSE